MSLTRQTAFQRFRVVIEELTTCLLPSSSRCRSPLARCGYVECFILSALVREHLYGLPDELVIAIGKHYIFALLRQVYRVILRVEPTGALDTVRTLGTGVKDLFYLPAKAVVRSPRALARKGRIKPT